MESLKYMGVEALFQTEEVVFEIDVPPESLENNNVPRYQLVKLCTKVGTNIGKSNRTTLCPPMVSLFLAASIYSLSLSLCFACLK